MNTRIRQIVVAVAFSATVALGITGATLRGETKETNINATCQNAAWPMIPAECLQGRANDVRYVSPDNVAAAETAVPTAAKVALADRFETAFQ